MDHGTSLSHCPNLTFSVNHVVLGACAHEPGRSCEGRTKSHREVDDETFEPFSAVYGT